MQTANPPDRAGRVFATREVRRHPSLIHLDLLCPTETEDGMRARTTCFSRHSRFPEVMLC